MPSPPYAIDRPHPRDGRSPDLLLLHAPSVYDFRERAILYGPVSDMVPSSTVFEMYPLGFLTMAGYLGDRGYAVRIVNLALRMMNDRSFDVPRFLAGLTPWVVGIDLHWLPHAHGALEVARIVKEIHPHVPIVFGGLSATYYHAELIAHPEVDFVLRGDSTEPPLYQLLRAIEAGDGFEDVPNLTWKQGTRTRVNAHSFAPTSLDYVDVRPGVVADMVMRYRDLESTLPARGWWSNPITAMLTVKGCSHECITCGACRTACTQLMQRQEPAVRSPASLVENLRGISKLSRGPIFLVGDVLQPGLDYAREVLSRLREARLENEIAFEFLDLPPASFMTEIADHVPNWSMELSPDSHDHAIRRAQDGEPFYTNEEMEAVFAEALRSACRRIDVFFMIGLPLQTHASVLETIDYCEHLFERFDNRLACFISPLGPFLDPGSRAFEQPERFGYRLFARTLEEHRELLVQPSWEHILNYETEWMTRRQLVDATYDAASRLTELKLRYGRIPEHSARQVAARVAAAMELRKRIDAATDADGRVEAPAELLGDITKFSLSTVCDKQELFWARHAINFKLGGAASLAWQYLTGRRT